MLRLKALIGLATMLGLLAVAAAPASAWWESTNGTTHGPSQLKEGSSAEFEIAKGTPILKCTTVPDEWKIRKSETSQEPVLLGGHLNITSKWEGCSVTVLGIKVPVTVSGCELQMEQVKGALTATGSVISTCVIVITNKPTCTIEVTPTGNQKLGKITLANVGTTQEDKVEITGITSTYPTKTTENAKNAETCKGELGAAGKEGSFKAIAIEHEVKAV